MKSSRHLARTAALQGLYQLDIQSAPADAEVGDVLEPLLAENELIGEPAEYARQLIAGVWSTRERFDEMIASVSDRWDVSRMAAVDRNVLRLALYEIIERPDVPVRVAIDEAIELGREFGDNQTAQFVNGVLDAVYKKHPACRIARGDPE
jgi:N utilization substance protein B